MMYNFDAFPPANPERDLAKARSRAVAIRNEIAAIKSGAGASGCAGTNADRLQALRIELGGREDEMAALVRHMGKRRTTDEERLQKLARIQGEKPKDRSPVRLDGAVRKSAPAKRSLGYVTKDIVPGRG
jgi:hypothetical protein